MFITIIIFILTLLVLVLIHELGHFLLAKRFGIKVLEFGFGIPPRVWGKKIGETIISLNWLPFGGFVRLLGEDKVDKKIIEDKRSFASQIVSKRIAVVIAGVLMNLIFAWILFYIVLGASNFKFQLPLILDHKFIGVDQRVESWVLIAALAKDSPAEKAGLKSGERIVSINNEVIKDDQDIIQKTKTLAGKEVKLEVFNPQSKTSRVIILIPRTDPPAGQGPMGVALTPLKLANLEYQTPIQKLTAGPIHSLNLTVYSGKIFQRLINQAILKKTLQPISQTVAGPVGITSIANAILTSAKNPLLPYLDFVGLLSLNLAIVNLLPFPALDGGRLLFLLIEATTRRRVHAEVERWVHTIGMAILLTLIVLVTFADIQKLFLR